MEDALWGVKLTTKKQKLWVLILIVLEDALWEKKSVFILKSLLIRLNPYCIGRCSLSLRIMTEKNSWIVLILIVLEDALWAYNKTQVIPYKNVLILIVLEDALWANRISDMVYVDKSLNPYCIGRCSLSRISSTIPNEELVS